MPDQVRRKVAEGLNSRTGERGRFVPVFVLLVSVAVTVFSTITFYYSARSKDVTRYMAGVDRIESFIKARLALHLALLHSTKGYLDADEHADRRRFSAFVESVELDNGYAGIQGIGYTQIFKQSERGALIARMRAEGMPEFSPYPDSDREARQAILYLVPEDERNRRAIGFDMSSEETRRAAIERARDSGKAAMSGRVTLVQEITQDKQAGFLIYLPVYKDRVTPSTVEERRVKIRGFAYAPFRAGDFFSEVERLLAFGDIAFEVYDSHVAVETMMSRSSVGPGNGSDFWSTFRTSGEIEFAGRKWVVIYSSRAPFSDQSIVWWTPLIFLSGLCLTAVLFAVARRQESSREKLRDFAVDLYRSEHERKALLEKEQEARQLAEGANIAKDEFLSVVSHELRTPLNAIAGWTRVLRGPDITEATKESAIEKIERNLKLQSTLVEDLLTFSQMDSPSMTPDREVVDFSAAVRSVLSELEPVSVEKSISMGFEDCQDRVVVMGDPEKLRIAVLKLVGNALKFTPNGGRVDIALAAGPDSARLTVRDNGVGIRKEFLPFVFERFKQHDSSTTRRFGGLGLGLSICSHIVEMHGGTIEVRSEGEGMGSEFTVTLPK